jgi:hypothetical protein
MAKQTMPTTTHKIIPTQPDDFFFISNHDARKTRSQQVKIPRDELTYNKVNQVIISISNNNYKPQLLTDWLLHMGITAFLEYVHMGII